MSKPTFGQALQALRLIHAKDPSLERLDALYRSGILSDLFDPNACLDDRNAVRTALKLGVVLPESMTLSVDYGCSLEQMIVAGYYDCGYHNITAKRFPMIGNGVEQFEVKIFHFGRSLRLKEIISAICSAGWDKGEIEHLLAFGKKYPEEQRKRSIIALGSVAIVGRREAPCLSDDLGTKRLSLLNPDLCWDDRFGFLAVRKQPSVPVA